MTDKHTDHAAHTEHTGAARLGEHGEYAEHGGHESHGGHVEHAAGHAGHTAPTAHEGHGAGQSLTRQAISATLHCLTGCAIGEILGMVIGTAAGFHNLATVILSIVLAFFFGYSLTMRPVLAAGIPFRQALKVALAADTLSIVTMEIVDNAFVLAVPGAMDAGLSSFLFWASLLASLAIAFALTVPVNRWLIGRGKGHAVMHAYH
ncbi:DUF4396 domain-containing protein [Kribbella monticola]|uniref:DUF4396 domain-containing protein n=1 Tax=Kribbella monticola TaxID=2185285 RepID=UPI000DD3358A|nr:DUF4396 domain-containing protein [Kribbella monticola]